MGTNGHAERALPPNSSTQGEEGPVLSVQDVKKYFHVRRALQSREVTIYAVDGVSFDLRLGETLGLVGESGCGKSTLARVVTGLQRQTAGAVLLSGVDLRESKSRESNRRKLQMVFQDPAGSLNPKRSVADSVAEPLLGRARKKDREERAARMLERVGLRTEHGLRFPHQLSGGQQQRACIARALISDPAVIVFDEALSSLDVSQQAQIADLIRDLQQEFGSSYLFITHDLATAFELSDRIAIMYLGEIVELVPVHAFEQNTMHPYSQSLVEAILDPDPGRQRRKQVSLLDADIPSAANPPSGCRFRTRCPYAQERCAAERPSLRAYGADHWVSCHFAGALPSQSTAAQAVGGDSA
jgi:oligopeptide/dipeptide ABC transporter ATP-binding protein